MRKKVLKYLLIVIALTGGTLFYLYAQKAYQQQNPPVSNVEIEEQTDNIGVLTDDDPFTEMDKLVASYYDKGGVFYKGIVKVIDDNGEQEKILEEYPFEYSVFNDAFHYSLDKMEVVQKKDMLLVVDNTNQIVSVSSIAGAATDKTKKLFDISEFKKMMGERKAEAKVTQLGNEKILTIENIQDPQIQGYRIYYNPSSFFINKMIIGMVRLTSLEEGDTETHSGVSPIEKKATENNDDNIAEGLDTYTYYLEIIYKEAKVLHIKDNGYKPENKFIKNNGKSIVLAVPYKNYQLIINNRETNREIMKNSEE